MIVRAIGLLLLMALGASWGLVQASAWATFAGVMLGTLVWLSVDGLSAHRLLRWLGKADLDRQPRLSGLWGELMDRSRKLVKKLDLKK